MAGMPAEEVARGLLRLQGEGCVAGLGESQLLERFSLGRDEVAFEALVERHGPMVLAVCRRALRDEHAAEDAFQATFLLLSRKAGSIRSEGRLGPWLHRVALRVATRSGQAEARRRRRESPEAEALSGVEAPKTPDFALRLAVHEALDTLPEKYRAPVVLCDLEGRTHDEAAQHLKWPLGSVKGRLSRARSLLKARLERRGVVGASGVLAALRAGEAVPSVLRELTVRGAVAFATDNAAGIAAGASSAAILLAQETMRAMTIQKCGTAAVGGLTLLLLTLGGVAALCVPHEGNAPARPQSAAPAVDPVSDPPQPQGLTGRQIAEQLRTKIETMREEHDRAVARAEGIAEEMEQIRQEKRELQQILNATNNHDLRGGFTWPKIEPIGPVILVPNPEERQKRVDEAQTEVKTYSKRMEQLGQEQRQLRLRAESLGREMEKLIARADAADERPGLPGTAQPGDLYVVEVLEALPGRPIAGERVVKPDGTLSLGFYGEIHVAGLTRSQIKEKVIAHMRSFLTDEALGLVGADPNDAEKTVPISPGDSARVFVDEVPRLSADPGQIQALERKLDAALREIDRLRGAVERVESRPR